MAEELHIAESLSKKEKYEELVPAIEALVAGEKNLMANLSNISAALAQTFPNLWTGFYVVEGEQLVLGPFQGPIACTRISFGKGVCGRAWKEKQTIVVPDVDAFPGHIACSSLSKSEIVVPVLKNSNVVAVLDIDSIHTDNFDTTDSFYLEKITAIASRFFN